MVGGNVVGSLLRHAGWSHGAGRPPRLVDGPGSRRCRWAVGLIQRISWIAGGLSLPAAIVFGMLGVRGQRDDRSQDHAAEDSAEHRPWRLVPVSQLRPQHVSVHGARSEAVTGDPEPSVPAYVPREYDERLRAQLHGAIAGGLVVVVGDSATGKSRSLYEAIRTIFGDWQVLLADDATAIRDAATNLPGRTTCGSTTHRHRDISHPADSPAATCWLWPTVTARPVRSSWSCCSGRTYPAAPRCAGTPPRSRRAGGRADQ